MSNETFRRRAWMAYPDPDDTDPTTLDTSNLSEAPVTVCGNDRRDGLRNAEGDHERSGRTLHEEETMRTGDEDKSLRDDGDLEVDNHVQLSVVGIRASSWSIVKSNTELVLEECGLHDDNDEDDTKIKQLALHFNEGSKTDDLR